MFLEIRRATHPNVVCKVTITLTEKLHKEDARKSQIHDPNKHRCTQKTLMNNIQHTFQRITDHGQI